MSKKNSVIKIWLNASKKFEFCQIFWSSISNSLIFLKITLFGVDDTTQKWLYEKKSYSENSVVWSRIGLNPWTFAKAIYEFGQQCSKWVKPKYYSIGIWSKENNDSTKCAKCSAYISVKYTNFSERSLVLTAQKLQTLNI